MPRSYTCRGVVNMQSFDLESEFPNAAAPAQAIDDDAAAPAQAIDHPPLLTFALGTLGSAVRLLADLRPTAEGFGQWIRAAYAPAETRARHAADLADVIGKARSELEELERQYRELSDPATVKKLRDEWWRKSTADILSPFADACKAEASVRDQPHDGLHNIVGGDDGLAVGIRGDVPNERSHLRILAGLHTLPDDGQQQSGKSDGTGSIHAQDIAESRDGLKPGQWPGAPYHRLPPDCPVVPLGVNGQQSYFVDSSGQIQAIAASDWGKKMLMLLFARQPGYLVWAWPRFSQISLKINGINVDSAVQCLMKAAADRGLFSPEGQPETAPHDR